MATNEPGSVSQGMGYTVPMLAEESATWPRNGRSSPGGVADDACFSKQGHDAGSIAEEFRQAGVYFIPAKKETG